MFARPPRAAHRHARAVAILLGRPSDLIAPYLGPIVQVVVSSLSAAGKALSLFWEISGTKDLAGRATSA